MAVYNKRGIIAENYYDLQGLGVLDAARDSAPLPPGSLESALRSVLQAVEIAIINLADLLGRAVRDLDEEKYGTAMVKIFWMKGFHRVLGRLSVIPQQLGGISQGSPVCVLHIADSPGLSDYIEQLKNFDRAILALVESKKLPLIELVKNASLDSIEYNLIHLARIANQESRTWERNLGDISLPIAVLSYRDWVMCDRMHEAVYERILLGDTYFTQFRGLHQIPEILAVEVNNRLEAAIRSLRQNEFVKTVEHLDFVSVLMEGMLAALPPMVDSLATSDYHEIRENLGQTSGSHSVGLRYHLFTDLYEQLAQEVVGRSEITEKLTLSGPSRKIESKIDAKGPSFVETCFLSLIVTRCLKLRADVFQWRDQHLHLPRNNLGGESTKSLTGSPDAVVAVQRMADTARSKDPMASLAQARGLPAANQPRLPGKLTEYLISRESLDAHILATTGRGTQERFANVQERAGYFANASKFVRPRRRSV